MKRTPCPDCGEHQTLEMLRWEIARLERIKDRSQRQTPFTGYHSTVGSTTISVPTITSTTTPMILHSTGIANIGGPTSGTTTIGTTTNWDLDNYPELPRTPPNDACRVDGPRYNGAECCINCSRFYNPHAKSEAADLKEKIEVLRVEVLSPLEALAHAADD